ncbi:MAG TPA: tail fiber domain-containing protein, partial [Flavobacteriales bacterium]|nr:tail fiber domain-containing protein [Flavobacteriales bacterium]
TLRVRGDQLPVNDAFVGTSLATFRTDVGNGNNQNWSMVRGALEIGRLWHTNPSTAFVVQARQPDGNLWLRNSENDGVVVHFNGAAGALLNSYTLNRQAFVAIGEDMAQSGLGPNAPWSRVHLVHPTQGAAPATFGYRPQFRNGITLTGNSDLAYVGQLYDQGAAGTGAEQDDNSAFGFVWGDNALPAGDAHAWDHATFRFVGALGAGGSAGTVNGLELLRLRPYRANANDPVQGFVGVGDYVNSATQPSERLDVLNGKVRIRSLPTDPLSSSNEVVTVNMTTGVLEHRPFSNLPNNCEWEMGSLVQHVWTAEGAADPACPDAAENVGIGTPTPTAKLHVVDDTPDANNAIFGIRSFVQGGAVTSQGLDVQVTTGAGSVSTTRIGGNFLSEDAENQNYGVKSVAQLSVAQAGGSQGNRGVYGQADVRGGITLFNTGVEGQAAFTAGSLATNNLGVRGFASGLNDPGLLNNVGVMGQASFARQNYGGWFFAESPGPAENYGVRARATQATTNYGIRASAAGGTTNWAGWFEDDVWVQGNIHLVNGTIVISDQNLKTNITDLTDGLSRVLQLAPKSYQFLTADYPMMELSPDPQIGLLAQEVQQVIPEAVATAVYPAQYDTLGNQVSAAFPVMGVDYVKLIPLLIGAIREQQAQLAAMQQDLAACCAVDGSTDQRSMSPGAGAGTGGALRTDLFIVPNPVADHTQLRYTVATPGRTRLEVSDASGKRLEVLEEAVREAGAYTHDWTTTDLAPGTYHVTLFLNDSFVVKKAVKVGR